MIVVAVAVAVAVAVVTVVETGDDDDDDDGHESNDEEYDPRASNWVHMCVVIDKARSAPTRGAYTRRYMVEIGWTSKAVHAGEDGREARGDRMGSG